MGAIIPCCFFSFKKNVVHNQCQLFPNEFRALTAREATEHTTHMGVYESLKPPHPARVRPRACGVRGFLQYL